MNPPRRLFLFVTYNLCGNEALCHQTTVRLSCTNAYISWWKQDCQEEAPHADLFYLDHILFNFIRYLVSTLSDSGYNRTAGKSGQNLISSVTVWTARIHFLAMVTFACSPRSDTYQIVLQCDLSVTHHVAFLPTFTFRIRCHDSALEEHL